MVPERSSAPRRGARPLAATANYQLKRLLRRRWMPLWLTAARFVRAIGTGAGSSPCPCRRGFRCWPGSRTPVLRMNCWPCSSSFLAGAVARNENHPNQMKNLVAATLGRRRLRAHWTVLDNRSAICRASPQSRAKLLLSITPGRYIQAPVGEPTLPLRSFLRFHRRSKVRPARRPAVPPPGETTDPWARRDRRPPIGRKSG